MNHVLSATAELPFMSYILDALRRAEAQRSRGRVPGLHEPGGPAVPVGAPAAVSRRPLILGLAVLLLVALLAAAWFFRDVGGEGGPPPGAAALSAEPPLAASSPPSAAPLAAAPANPNPTTPASIESLPTIPLPRSVQMPQRQAATREASAEAAAATAAKPALASAAPSTPSPTPAAPAVLPTREELPQQIQRSLPAIAVSGSVYSNDPRQRILVVNGEVWHEGDEIRPGLVLEQIRRRDAVLGFRGYRFSVGP